MPNLITRIPPRSTVCVYNCVGSRQAKLVVSGVLRDGERWGAIAILAQERAYPLKVTIRHPLYSNSAKFGDGAASGVARRAAYQGSFDGADKVSSAPPTKGRAAGHSVNGECSMTIISPDYFPAPAGPRVLADNYPGGVSLWAQECGDAPNATNDARELHLCACGALALDYTDFCDTHEPTRVHTICTFLNTNGARPVECHAPKVDGAEFCVSHQPKKRRQRVAAPKRAGKKTRARRSARQETLVEVPDLGVNGG